MPERVMGIEEDPYRFKTLKLNVDFTYRKDTYTGAITENTESFEQRYSLDVKGFVINPNLLVYNAGIEFVDEDIGGTSGESHNNLNKYVFGSTLLRKSRIPLTLAASRSTTDVTFGGETTTDTLNADWDMKFRTLPWTRLTYGKTHTLSILRDEETESYGIGMTKAIGPTSNSINYSSTATSDDIGNYGSRYNVIAIRTDATLPLKTKFYLGVVNNDSLTFADTYKKETDTTAGSVGLRTDPVAGFNQNYNYVFTNTRSDYGESDSEYFNGMVGYNPSKSLNMSMGIRSLLTEASLATGDTYSSTSDNYYSAVGYNSKLTKSLDVFMSMWSSLDNKASSATPDATSKSINLLTGTRYTISSELSTTESIRYSQTESTSGDPLIGKTGRTITDTSAALNYLKKLSWSTLSAGTSLGHYKETVEPGISGEGVSYGFNTGLSGINMNYFTLSSGYNYYAVDSPDVYRAEQTFTSNADSSHLSHLPVTAQYTYHTLDSYLDGEDGVENTVGVNASILYLKRLPITLSYTHYTLVRPNDPNDPISDLQYVYVSEKVENTVTATASMLYLKWFPTSASYSRYTLVQHAIPSANPSVDQQLTHLADKKDDTISLSSSLIYFKNTTASVSAAYKSYSESVFNSFSWVSQENSYNQRSMEINGSHATRLYRGNLTISTGYTASTTNNTTANTKEDISNLSIKGTYNKILTRNMRWSLEAERSYTDTNGRRNTITSGHTNIRYQLRQWLLSAEYLHAVREQGTTGGSIVTEDKVMLKLSRSFVRIF